MEEHNVTEQTLRHLGIAFLILLFISGAFEIGLLIYRFINADRVECNLLWCSFIKEEKITSQECFMNGEKINCSEIEDYSYQLIKSYIDNYAPQVYDWLWNFELWLAHWRYSDSDLHSGHQTIAWQELVDHHLGRVDEVSVLSFPDHQAFPPRQGWGHSSGQGSRLRLCSPHTD